MDIMYVTIQYFLRLMSISRQKEKQTNYGGYIMVATSDMMRILRNETRESECMYILNGIRPKKKRTKLDINVRMEAKAK